MQEKDFKEIIRKIVESYMLPRDVAEELLKRILAALQEKEQKHTGTEQAFRSE